jgi:hypothetical protein
MMPAPSTTSQLVKIYPAPQTEASLHQLSVLAAGSDFHSPVTSCARSIPINSLNMIIHRDADILPSLLSSVFYYPSTSFRFHSLAKSVNSQSTANLRLISALRH